MVRDCIAAFALVLLTAGCGDDDRSPVPGADAGLDGNKASGDGVKAGLVLKGKLVAAPGEPLPAKVKLTTLWMVGAAGPDYMYKLGQVSVSGNTFQLTLPPGSPPAAAISMSGAGIGNVTVISDAINLPDGKLTSGAVKKGTVIGWDTERALIYRPATLPGGTIYQWLEPFPVGLSCGKFTGEKTGFAPADCASFKITVTASPKNPPWW
jgi:hypothetical protein